MIPIRHRWPEATSAARPAGSLTSADIARLDAKHDEIIMVLRLWHGYGLMAADRALSHWMYHNSRPHAPRTEDIRQV